MPITLTGWRYAAFLGVIVGGIGLAVYPIAIHPIMHVEDYSKFSCNKKGCCKREKWCCTFIYLNFVLIYH